MSTPRRPPMPKLPPFALADAQPHVRKRLYYLAIFFALFTVPLFLIHLHLLNLPFFWDEQGQFIPTALDLLRTGSWFPQSWVAHSTLPNVHPPGVELYLVLWYKLFGYSIAITRLAMLLLAGVGLLLTFLLAIRLSAGTKGAPAFLPPLFLLSAPLFYTQSMMAQLDMPAMVFTLLALLCFLKQQYRAAALASIALVLAKETGIIAPFIFFLLLAWRKQWRLAALFLAPCLALLTWLAVLHHATGYWLGNPGFAHYNVAYSLNPVRMAFSLLRHAYYLFLAEFRWIGTLVLILTWRRTQTFFRTEPWRFALLVAAGNALLVSILGGAELERYLLPSLPVFYIAVAVGITYLSRRLFEAVAVAGLLAGQIFNLFWNPPYPFPYENNYAMVDFVRLQQIAASFTEANFSHAKIATAWPYTAALRNPDFGFVSHSLTTLETNDFHAGSILRLPPASFNVLIVYTRTWMPSRGVIALPFVRRFLTAYYEWQPEISPQQCLSLGLRPVISWSVRGQEITIYVRQPQSARTTI
jgi:4-amino-4-deoxy-L-arabinose transferase-like glycosyltransferase